MGNNDYKIGIPAYMEFTNKGGYPISGVYFIVSQDRYYIEIRDEEVLQIVSKRSIRVFEPVTCKC